MSRVNYANTPATSDQEGLRTQHRVRLVTTAEEGTGVNALPNGIYGFTYSPGLRNAPLFALRRYRTFETHKLENGDTYLIGFATPENAATLESATSDATFTILPEPEPGADVLVKIPYGRIHHHKQYAAPNQHGFTLTVFPNA